MGPDNVTNLPRKRFARCQYGIAGVTLISFLLTQLAWPLPISAQEMLRQQPPAENRSGLEELKTKFRAKQEAAAGLEEMITLMGPSGPIQYQVPKIVKLAIEQLTTQASTSTQKAITTLLGPRPLWKRFSSLLSNHPTFFFWALEHVPDSQTPLDEEDRKRLATDLIRSMDSSGVFQPVFKRLTRDRPKLETPEEQVDTAIAGFEMWRYVLLRILLIEQRLRQLNHLTKVGEEFFADSYKLIAINLESTVQGSQITHPRAFLEGWLFQLGVEQPELKGLIGRFLEEWKNVDPHGDADDIIYGGLEPWQKEGWVSPHQPPADILAEDGVSSERVVDDLTAQSRLMTQLRALQEAIDPKTDSVRQQAWQDPLRYLITLAKGKKTIIFKSTSWEGGQRPELPNKVQVQLGFLDQIGDGDGPLGQESVKKWAIVIPYSALWHLFNWLHDARAEITGGMLAKSLQGYLNAKGEVPIRSFLDLPDQKEPVGATGLLNAFQRLRAIREKNKAEITLFYLGKEVEEPSYRGDKPLANWLAEHVGDAKVVLDIGNLGTHPGRDVPETLVSEDSVVWITQRMATEHFPANAEDETLAKSLMFQHAAFLIGESQGWGDFQSSAIPIRQNDSLLHLLETEDFETIRRVQFNIWLLDDRPFHAFIMTSPSDGNDEEEPATPFMAGENGVASSSSAGTLVPVGFGGFTNLAGLEEDGDEADKADNEGKNETRREFLIDAQRRLMAIRAILEGDILGPIAQILGQPEAADLEQLGGFVGVFEYLVNLGRMQGIHEDVEELSKTAESARQNVLSAPVIERREVARAWLVIEPQLRDFEKSGETAILADNVKQTLGLFQQLATATPDARESTMRETTRIIQHAIQEEIRYWEWDPSQTESSLDVFKLPPHVNLRKWFQIVTKEDHDKFKKQRIQSLEELRAHVEHLASLPPRQQFPVFQVGLKHAIEQIRNLSGSSHEKLTAAAEVLEQLNVTLSTLPLPRLSKLSERMREGWNLPTEEERGGLSVEEYIKKIEELENQDEIFPDGFIGKFLGLEPFRTENAPPPLLRNDFQNVPDLSRRQKPTVTLSLDQKSLPPGWDPVTEAEMLAWKEAITGHKGHLAIVLGAVPKGHPGLPRLAKVAQHLHEEFPDVIVSFFYTDQEALYSYRNERKLYLPAFRAWAANPQGGLHAVAFNELSGLNMLDEFAGAFSAGLEEVRFYEGLTKKATGAIAPDAWIVGTGLEEGKAYVAPGQHRAVVNLPAKTKLGITRIFIHPDLPWKDFAGLEEVQLPADVAQVPAFMREFELRDTDLIVLPLTISRGSEASWRPANSRAPTLVISASGLEEANSQILAALARIARNLEGQVLRVGLEEWAERVLSWEENLMSISY